MDNPKISFKPNSTHLEKIRAWLQDEEASHGTGFFCNWHIITDSFENQKMAVLLLKTTPIGFITWFEREKVTTIQIAEIRHGYRRMGYCRLLAEALFEKLLRKGKFVLELHCQPAASEKAWKKLGFARFPDVDGFARYNSEHGRHLYRILVPYLKPTQATNIKDQVELWSVEPHYVDKASPKWRWKVKFDGTSDRLEKPIIFPAKKDWNIRRTRNGVILKDDKVKYFDRYEDIDFGDFIIIEKIQNMDIAKR